MTFIPATLRVAGYIIASIYHFFAGFDDIPSQLLGHYRVKPGKLLPHLHVLLLEALYDLEDEIVLVVEVIHDMADFLFALDVAVVIALRGKAIFFCLAKEVIKSSQITFAHRDLRVDEEHIICRVIHSEVFQQAGLLRETEQSCNTNTNLLV